MGKEAVEFLKQLLEIPSVNGSDDERRMAEYLAGYFQEHGIHADVQYLDNAHANVIAFIPGQDPSRTMIWNGHLDTVPCGSREEWVSEPLKAAERDGKIYARGASDMKSGLAAMVYALCHAPGKPAYNIQFLGTCDEEKDGRGAEGILREKRMEEAECLLIGEPTGMRLGTAQKGCLWLEMNLKGKTSHGAYPGEGVSAIHHGVHMAGKLGDYVENWSSELLGRATAQVTMIEGGVAWNMTADTCRICMDIRMVPGLTTQMVLQQAELLLLEEQKTAPGLEADFRVQNDRRAIEIEKDHPMPSALRKIIRAHGYDGDEVGICFFTDASVLDREGEKKILLFGPGDPSMAHKPNEYVIIKKYEDAILILQELMQDRTVSDKAVRR